MRKGISLLSCFFVLGLLSKPMLVTLPFVLLLLDYWPLRRFHPDPWKTEAWPLIREKVPFFLLSFASCVVTFLVQRSGGAVLPIDVLPFDLRMTNALVSYVRYLGKMLWPQGLALFYPYISPLPLWQVAGSALLLIAITLGVIRLGRKYPYLAVGWLWYLGTLVPVIGLVQVGAQSMADRYTYVPLIGIFIMIALGLPDLLSRWPRRWIVLAPSAAIVLAALLMVARIQVSHWKNSFQLFEHTLAVTARNHFFHSKLGMLLAKQGKLPEAMAHFVEALRINPRYAESHYNLGNAFLEQGKTQEAIFHFIQALQIQPDLVEAHNNLGNILYEQGKSQDAISHFTEAVRIKPDYPEARYNLGVSSPAREPAPWPSNNMKG